MRRSLATAVLLAAAFAASSAVGGCSPDPLGGLRKDAPGVAAAIEAAPLKYPQARKRKIVLLAMDSCDPDLVDEFIRAGKLPNFARLRREGAWGDLQSLVPVLSPVVWTTVATGMPPERHGILDFVTQTPDGMRPVTSRMRQADTVWELIAAAGEPVGVVGWMVSWPAEPIDGYLVTERIAKLALEGNRYETGESRSRTTYPAELAAEIAGDRVTIDDLPLEKMRAFVDVSEQEWADAYMTTFSDPRNLLGALRLIQADAETFRRVGTRLKRERDTRFFACYFNAMDSTSHYFMRYAAPKMPDIPTEDYLRYHKVIEASYRWHDRVLGEFLDLCDADTTVILVSDHGFKHGDLRMPQPSHFDAKTGAMWHRQYGVFFAWGNGVKHGERVTGATVFDIAPTILAAMGYPVPEDMPGKVLDGAFEGGLPHETVPTWFGERRRKSLAAANAAGADEVGAMTAIEREELDKMRALGYVGGDRDDPASTTLNLAARLLATGRVPRAIEELEKLLADSRQANNPRLLLSLADAHLRMARAMRDRDEPADAAEHLAKVKAYVLRTAPVVDDDSDLLLVNAKIAEFEENWDEAVRLAELAVARRPWLSQVNNVLASIWKTRVEAQEATGDRAAAAVSREHSIAAFRESLRHEPRQWYALNEVAHLLLSTRSFDSAVLTANAEEALHHLDLALELLPDSPKAWNNRAIALLRLGMSALRSGDPGRGGEHLANALDSAEHALAVRSDYDLGWANKAYVLMLLDRLDDARAAALEARRITPTYKFDDLLERALAQKGIPLPPAAE